MNHNYLIDIINDIHNSNIIDISLKDAFFSNKYSDFKKKHPVIYKMTLEGKMDYDILAKLLLLKDKIDNNKLDQTKASEEAGTLLFDKYVKPELHNMKKTDIQNNEPKINIVNGGENISLSMGPGTDN